MNLREVWLLVSIMAFFIAIVVGLLNDAQAIAESHLNPIILISFGLMAYVAAQLPDDDDDDEE